MSNRAKATVCLKFSTEKQLSTLLDALTPETQAPATRCTNVKLERDGAYLVLLVEAEDTVALRATLNAYLHWINSTINVIDVVGHA
jgi:tRNA threonylcarbamoyladenosine modification (KEOPS) complex  Pcc1 subunit